MPTLIVENVLTIIYGAANVTYGFGQGKLHHVGPFLWTTSDIEVIISALAVAGLIYLLLQRTRYGKAVRAISQATQRRRGGASTRSTSAAMVTRRPTSRSRSSICASW